MEQRKVAVRLRSRTASHSAFCSSTAGLRAARPALLTRRSISPMRAKASFTAFSSVTSQPSKISSDSTRAPCLRRSATVAAPMPLAPCREADRERVMRNLTHVEGMSLDVLRQGIRWEFETIPQYLDMLERQGAAINLAVFAGHSALRTYVMGEAATQRAATDAEIDSMRNLVLEAMRAGAIGFSTSTSPAHNGEA